MRAPRQGRSTNLLRMCATARSSGRGRIPTAARFWRRRRSRWGRRAPAPPAWPMATIRPGHQSKSGTRRRDRFHGRRPFPPRTPWVTGRPPRARWPRHRQGWSWRRRERRSIGGSPADRRYRRWMSPLLRRSRPDPARIRGRAADWSPRRSCRPTAPAAGARQRRQGGPTAALPHRRAGSEAVRRVRAIYARTSSSLLRRAGYIEVEDADATLARQWPTALDPAAAWKVGAGVDCALAPADPHNSSTDTTVDTAATGPLVARRPINPP